MRRRAEQVDETRLRITEAAVRLHTTVGPANTSIASVAQEAGVTRLTVYRHFADLDSLFEACTAHWRAQHAPPDAEDWAATPGLGDRARRGFGELYAWYREHSEELYPIYRDAASIPRSAQLATNERNAYLAEAILAEDASDPTAYDVALVGAIARHLVAFRTWHSLAVEQGLDHEACVSVAVLMLTAVV